MLKRTNIVLDDQLIKQLKKVTGEKTVRGAVINACQHHLEERERWKRMQLIRKYKGSGIWEGDLNELRRDRFTHSNL